MTFSFPFFLGCYSHPIHNPLTFISECKDTIKIFYLQEKNKEKCQNYNNATIVYVFATKRAFTTNLHYNTKNIWLCKKTSRNKHHFQIFYRLFFFPSRNFSFTNMQPSKNFGFIEAKQLKNEGKSIYTLLI